MAVKKGDILRNKRTNRWFAVLKVTTTTSDPEVDFVSMWKVRTSDGVAYGQKVVGIMLNETSKTPDDLPIGYSRPECIPETLKVWRE